MTVPNVDTLFIKDKYLLEIPRKGNFCEFFQVLLMKYMWHVHLLVIAIMFLCLPWEYIFC